MGVEIVAERPVFLLFAWRKVDCLLAYEYLLPDLLHIRWHFEKRAVT